MKRILLVIACLLAARPVFAWPEITRADLDITFAPPNNEPVLGDRLARYRLRFFHRIQWWRFGWEGDNSAWGMDGQWQASDLSHGLDTWSNADWSTSEWRYIFINRLTFRIVRHFDLFVETKDTKNYPGPQGTYYNLVGVRVQFIDF